MELPYTQDCNNYEMPYQELVDIGGKLSTHQKLHCLVVKISKSINISDPVFMEVLHAELLTKLFRTKITTKNE